LTGVRSHHALELLLRDLVYADGKRPGDLDGMRAFFRIERVRVTHLELPRRDFHELHADRIGNGRPRLDRTVRVLGNCGVSIA
jgi:hypothetical protein